jgi:hypothetical protein
MTEMNAGQDEVKNSLSDFQVVAASFVHDLDALRQVLNPVMVMALVANEEADKEHLDALNKYGNLSHEDDDRKVFDIPAEHLSKINVVARKNAQAETAVKLLPRTFLVSFVSVYDAYLGRLIKVLLETKSEVLESSERSFSYKQLAQFDSIETARSRIIESEIDSVLRQSHSDQFKWIESKFNIKLRSGLNSWPDFIELTERRNLFVHTHGVVSSQYISVCKSHGCEVSCVVGDTLEADREYLVNSYKCLFEIGTKLYQVLWRKLCPKEIEYADIALNTLVYDLILEEKYDISRRLLEFAVNVLPRHADDSYRRMFVVNLAQVYKFSGLEKDSIDLLSKDDWSACNDRYAICVNVLKDEFDSAAIIMERIGASGLILEKDYLNWPIFKIFRESSQFKLAFKKVFGHDPVKSETHDRQPLNSAD